MSVGPVLAALAGLPSSRLVYRFGTWVALLAGLVAMASEWLVLLAT